MKFHVVTTFFILIFYLDNNNASSSGCDDSHTDLVTGNNSCCTTSNLCAEAEGDCDSDSECAAGLLCGSNNCSWDETDPDDDCCQTTYVTTIIETSLGTNQVACDIRTTTTQHAGKQFSCVQNLLPCDAGDHGKDESYCEVSDNMDQVRACSINRCVSESDVHCSLWDNVQATLTYNSAVTAWSGQGTGKINLGIKCTYIGLEHVELSQDVATLIQNRKPESQSGTLLSALNNAFTTDITSLSTSYLMVEKGWHPQVANLAIGMDTYDSTTFTPSNAVADEFKSAISTAWGYDLELIEVTATSDINSFGVMANFTINLPPPTACSTANFYSEKPGIVVEKDVIKFGGGLYNKQKAFDGDRTTLWRWYMDSTTDSWIKYDFERREIINRYTIIADIVGSPKSWTVGGSNNNSTFTDLSVITDQSFGTIDSEVTYTFSNTNAYRWYRLYMTDYNNSGQTDKYVGIREIYFTRCETVGVSAGEACSGNGPGHKRPHCLADAKGK
eukprot:g6519.t1